MKDIKRNNLDEAVLKEASNNPFIQNELVRKVSKGVPYMNLDTLHFYLKSSELNRFEIAEQVAKFIFALNPQLTVAKLKYHLRTELIRKLNICLSKITINRISTQVLHTTDLSVSPNDCVIFIVNPFLRLDKIYQALKIQNFRLKKSHQNPQKIESFIISKLDTAHFDWSYNSSINVWGIKGFALKQVQ